MRRHQHALQHLGRNGIGQELAAHIPPGEDGAIDGVTFGLAERTCGRQMSLHEECPFHALGCRHHRPRGRASLLLAGLLTSASPETAPSRPGPVVIAAPST